MLQRARGGGTAPPGVGPTALLGNQDWASEPIELPSLGGADAAEARA